MADEDSGRAGTSTTQSELYFLIAKFLANGPCKESANALRREIEQHELFSTRFDWKGNQHQQSFKNLDGQNSHIEGDHLLKIVSRIGQLLDKDVKPRVHGVKSLLGGARQSLLRTAANVKPPLWSPSVHVALFNQRPLAPPNRLAHVPNAYNVIRGRQLCGAARLDHIVPGERYGKTTLYLRTLGHLSSAYCVLFDYTGRRIFTGADDHLVKIWSADDGRLLATLRGHSAEIVDMNVNYENTLLAAASNDKVIRVWNLQTLTPVAVLMGHTAMITSLEFSPFSRSDIRYMASTGADGCVCVWVWDRESMTFHNKPIRFQERNRPGSQMLCLSFSPGGTFLAAGGTDTVIRVYTFKNIPPEKVTELEGHTDRVDSIGFCHCGSRFISGSKDGTARVWRYERQEWKNILLNMSTRLPGSKVAGLDEGNKIVKHRVTMVGWNKNDQYVITAVNDHSLRVWNSFTGKLVYELLGHTDEVYVMEGHPKDVRIYLSGGHDGLIFLWDLSTGHQLYRFFNTIEGQGYGSIYDCKFSPSGDCFVATDSHGHLSIFGPGSKHPYEKVPTEQFFHTDYRPLVRDANNYVLDEQTQQAPHLMPPPFLVDIDGNPHPPLFQRLVPGRENCTDSALVPQIGVAENGNNEVIGEGEMGVEPELREPEVPDEEAEANQAASLLDELIHRMQQEQDGERGDAHLDRPRTPGRDRSANGPLSPSLSPRGLRRAGEIEGVRQATGNVPVSQRASQAELLAFKTRVVVPELSYALARYQRDYRRILDEEACGRFKVEKKKKPLPLAVETTDSADSSERLRRRRKTKSKVNHSYRTRSNQDGQPLEEWEAQEEERRRQGRHRGDREGEDGDDTLSDMEEQVDDGAMSGAETSEEEIEWHSTSEHESESSEYSDWTADAGINLQPPKKKTRRKGVPWESDGSTSASPQKTPSTTPMKSKRKRRPPKALIEDMEIEDDKEGMAELPEEMKPPPWITDTIPRRCPYVPQMGDEAMYFRQGHEAYVAAVKKRKVYYIEPKKQYWTKLNLKDHELVRVTGIKYQVGPPTLCGLKLAFMDPDTSKPTGGSFSIKYHDMPDVIDFLVLRQHYDQAVGRKWKPGDRFRSMIDDAWWLGTIVAHNPLESEHPDSLFQCYLVDWDNGECERMSPWDLEPIDEDNLPESKGGSIPVTDEELLGMLYVPGPGEWGNTDRDTFCDRLMKCLQQVMSLRIAEQFNTPVDLNRYPSYAYFVPYPTDLSNMMQRLERRYYRRVTALQWEVRRIEQNALVFNERDSIIVQWAETLVKILLEVIKDDHCDDVMAIYNRISRDSDVDGCESGSDDKPGPSNRARGKKNSPSKKQKRKAKACYNSKSWVAKCKELLKNMWDCQDSEPFRVPVDERLYPDYREIIHHPMDMTTLKQQLDSGSYQDPMDLGKDIRLMFTNAKNFTPNKKSRIYSMTLRLSALFEDHFMKIVGNYKSAIKYEKQVKNGFKKRQQLMSSSPEDRHSSPRKQQQQQHRKSRVKRSLLASQSTDSTDMDAPGPSGINRLTSRPIRSRRRGPVEDHDDDDDIDVEGDDDGEEEEKPGTSRVQGSKVNSVKASRQRMNGFMKEEEEEEEDTKSGLAKRLKTSRRAQSESKHEPKGGKGKVKKKSTSKALKQEEDEEKEEEEDGEDTEIDENAREAEEEEEEDSEKTDGGSEGEEDDSDEEEDDDDDDDEEEEEEEEEEEQPVRKTRLRTRRDLTNGYKTGRKAKQVEDSDEEDEQEEEEEGKEDDEEEEEENDSNYEAESDVGSNDGSESSTSESEDTDSDSESEVRTRRRTQSRNARRSSRRKKVHVGKKRKAKSKHSRSSPKKRPKKNEPSDDDQSYVPSHKQSTNTERRTRNQGRHMQYYGDFDESDNDHDHDNQITSGEEEDDDEEEGAAKSVSSRGRVRKMTPRARANMMGT